MRRIKRPIRSQNYTYGVALYRALSPKQRFAAAGRWKESVGYFEAPRLFLNESISVKLFELPKDIIGDGDIVIFAVPEADLVLLANCGYAEYMAQKIAGAI